MGSSIGAVAGALGSGLATFANHSAQAASRANGVSAAAQRAQGAFNQASADNANTIAMDRIAQQYGFNSAQVASANDFTKEMWNMSAAFNAEEAQKQRDWLEHMEKTKYQRAVQDMEAAGLNPILAVTGGGISAGGSGGSAASISPVQGQAASGGLLQGVSASEGNYSGQMEYMGGMLGLLSAGIAGISSALKSFGGLGEAGVAFANALSDIFTDKNGNYDSDMPNRSITNGLGSLLKHSFKPTGGGIYGAYNRLKNRLH